MARSTLTRTRHAHGQLRDRGEQLRDRYSLNLGQFCDRPQTGATLRELMDRMSYSSPRAALIYLHGSNARQQAIADGLGELAGPQLRKGE
jgi:hypothetical protein